MTDVPITAIQSSFAGGELSPTLFGRVDLAKYHTGLAICRNAFVDFRGGVSNRPGSRYVGIARDSTKKVRLIKFVYSSIQTYVLEFSNFTMRVIRNGGYVTEPTKPITVSGTIYTSVAHGFSTGDLVAVTDQVNPVFVTVINANTFGLTNIFTNAQASTLSPTVARVFTLTTPWADTDLALLKFTQSFDTMTLTHPSYQQYNLTRTQHWVWTLTAISPAAAIASPTISSITVTVTGGVTLPPAQATTGYGYRVTAVNAAGEESNPSALVQFQSWDMASNPNSYTVVWGAIAGADHYNIYRTSGVLGAACDSGAPTGYVGYSTDTTFQDKNIVPDFTKTPPTHQNPFASSNWPGCVTYFDQRRVFAGSTANPQTLWFSRPGQYNNFDTSVPANDGDALTETLSSTQSAAIKALVPMPSGLLVFTQSGIHQVSGGSQYAGVKVSSAVARAQNYAGASDVPPIPLNYEVLFVQSKGSIVRSVTYNFYSNTYQPDDLTIYSNHLFPGNAILEWAYAEHPYKIIWSVRDDGVLLSLTYMKDEKINGWARHDTNGLFQSVVSVEENNTDVIYVVVQRTINGQVYKFIEQFQARLTGNNSWYVDCGLDYSGSAVTTISGLEHLRNTVVSVLADGVVRSLTVSSTGTLTLPVAASRVIVGLSYQTQCATLDLEPQGQSVQGKRKRIIAVTAKVNDTLSLKWGPNFNELTPYTGAQALGVTQMPTGINAYYDYGGQLCWQQDDPLPMTVLSLVPELSVGD